MHSDVPYGMIDFAQESGRCGRAGEAVDSIIVVEEGRVELLAELNRGASGIDQQVMGRAHHNARLPPVDHEQLSGRRADELRHRQSLGEMRSLQWRQDATRAATASGSRRARNGRRYA